MNHVVMVNQKKLGKKQENFLKTLHIKIQKQNKNQKKKQEEVIRKIKPKNKKENCLIQMTQIID